MKYSTIWITLFVLCYLATCLAQTSRPVFADLTSRAEGLPFVTSQISGTAWGDFDNDGDQDLYLSSFGTNLLYRNNGDGTFSNIAAAAGVADSNRTKAANWGDINGDGWLDLYLSNSRDLPNTLYLNNTDGSFTEIGEAAGVADEHFAQGGAFIDFDVDGDLDFFLMQDDSGDRLFRNNGDLTFTDVAPELGMDNIWGAYGLVWFDYNDDGFIDLYIANCNSVFGANWNNLLFKNNGDGTFSDVSEATGLTYPRGRSWGSVAIDYDNDRDMDLLVVNSDGNDTFLLYQNRDSVFVEVDEQAGLPNLGIAFSVTSGDYDNDGDIDFLVAGFRPAIALYENKGDGTFDDISDRIAFPPLESPHYASITSADYDNDGFLDLVMANEGSDGRAYLFHNEPDSSAAGNAWLVVKLNGVQDNSFGIGAKVTAIAQDLKQIRTVTAGSGLYSQNMLPVHFGLGDRTLIDTLVVRWPNLQSDSLFQVAVNQIVEITQGDQITAVREKSARPPSASYLLQNYPNPFNPETTIRYYLAAPAHVSLTIYDLRGREIRTLVDEVQGAGERTSTWQGQDKRGREVPSGLYFYTLQAGAYENSGRMILLR
jgi:hypothetical protein